MPFHSVPLRHIPHTEDLAHDAMLNFASSGRKLPHHAMILRLYREARKLPDAASRHDIVGHLMVIGLRLDLARRDANKRHERTK